MHNLFTSFIESFNVFTMMCFIILILLYGVIFVTIIYYVRKYNKAIEQIQLDNESLKKKYKLYNKKLEKVQNPPSDNNNDEKISSSDNMNKIFKTFNKLSEAIKNDLSEALKKTNSCRLALYLFHNGTKSIQGLSFVKMSCVGEKIVIGSGIKSRMINHAGLMINLFDNTFSTLIDNGKYIIINNESITDAQKEKFISNDRVRYSIAVCIYDNNNNTLGFVLAEFNHPYTKELSDKETGYLYEFAEKIAPLLSFSEYANIAV